MKIRNLFYALLALPLFFVACGEDNAVDQVKNPTVKVTAGTAAETSLSFTVASTDATKVAYLVVEGSDVPTASEVLTSGTAVDANKSVTVTKDGLKTSTEYVIAVAAQNSVATVKDFTQMTTLSTITPGPEPGEGNEDEGTFTGTHLYTEYEADGGLHYYYFEIGNNTWNENGWGIVGGTYYSFLVISNKKGNGVLPNGTYTLAETYSSGIIANDMSYQYQITADNDLVRNMYSEAIVTISDGKIEANIVLENGDIHHVVYEGSLAVGDGGTQLPTEFEATHVADKWYWGGTTQLYGDKYAVSGEGFSVDVHFPAEDATETTLSTGLYTWTIDTAFGYNDFVEFTTRTFTVDGTLVPVDAGTALVEAESDVYHIEITLEGRDGNVYMIQYDGKLNDKGEVGETNNNLVVNTLSTGTYNDYYEFYTYKAAGDNFSLDLLLNKDNGQASQILAGDYTYAYEKAQMNTPGYFYIDNFYFDGIKYKASTTSTLSIATENTTDVEITLSIVTTDGSEFVVTYNGLVGGSAGEGGNEDEPSTPAEPVKLATPSVSGVVAGNAATVSWQLIDGAKDYTVTLNGDDVRTVTTSYVMYTNLEYETTYTVTVVANSSDEALYITSDAGTATFTTEAQPEDGGEEGGNTGDSGAPEGYITLDSCSYVGDLMGAGVADEFVLRSNDGNHVLYFNCNNTQTDPNNIPAGEYTIANVGEPGFQFNMSYLSGTTIINGVSYPNGVGNNSESTMVVASESYGGVHEIKLIINNNQGTTKYYYKGTIN